MSSLGLGRLPASGCFEQESKYLPLAPSAVTKRLQRLASIDLVFDNFISESAARKILIFFASAGASFQLVNPHIVPKFTQACL